jgi:hypothetical protein
MIIYSKTIQSQLSILNTLAKIILAEEMKIEVARKRFFYNDLSYPIIILAMEHPKKLGEFQPHSYRILINRKLFFEHDKEVLKNVLRHELAHYLTYIKYGSDCEAHGVEFRETCKNCGWGEEVYLSTYAITNQTEINKPAILDKIKKLLKLAASSNEHEASLATYKANQLLIKYNLELISLDPQDEIEYVVQTVYCSKKMNALTTAICRILPYFLVQPVINHTQNGIELEVTGSRVNVELAHYITDYLSREIPYLYSVQQKSDQRLRGVKAKNSFIKGIAKGFCQKLEQIKNENHTESNSKALINIENNLSLAVANIYGGTRKTSSQAKLDPHSLASGIQSGKKLNINPGVKSSSQVLLLKS